MATQQRWSSRLSFILATTGAAVGLGNIWKFPYMAGDNGGSAFILIYLLCVALIGIPLLINEIVLGKYGRNNAPDALAKIAQLNHSSTNWKIVGFIGIGTIALVLSFYSVVSGWAIFYLFKAISGQLQNISATQINNIWGQLLAHPFTMILWHSVFMLLTLGVVRFGVKNGLERASKIMMPLLYIILFFLVYFAYQHGNFIKALDFLFGLRLHDITPRVMIDALGHAFLTLALGAGAMLVYGAYIPEGTNIGRTVIIIALLDILVAFLSGLAIFPLVFKYNLAPTGGPGLMFQVLPIAFSGLKLGSFIGSLFFILLIFAAWTSSISMAEPIVLMITEKTKLARSGACVLVGAVSWALGLLSIFSFNVLNSVKILGRWDIFTFITDLVTNILLPLGGLGFAIFTGYVIIKNNIIGQLNFKNKILFNTWYFLVKYLSPIAILVIILETLI